MKGGTESGPAALQGVLSLEQSVNVPLQDGESRHCGRAGGGLKGGQLWRGLGPCCGGEGGAGVLGLVDG